MVWVTLGLLLNAVVMGYVFWPDIRENLMPADDVSVHMEPAPPEAESGQPEAAPTADKETATEPAEAVMPVDPVEPEYQAPTIIVPRPATQRQELTATRPQGRVPHLVELPLSFQKSIPDLTFNSHIVSSDPSASSVIINRQYLRAGDNLGQLLVEQVTEDSVIFSKNGRPFRVGTLRNWVSPR